jgi:preprotein translocase subunit Sec63
MSGNNIKDYYYILGIGRNASQDEIKKAYRKLSTKFHQIKMAAINFLKSDLRISMRPMRLLWMIQNEKYTMPA